MSHFETLWEEAEKLLDHETKISSFSELVKEAMGKLSALDALDSLASKSTSMPTEDLHRLKMNAVGKLLLVLTQLSAKDSLNVYAALRAAIDDKKITLFEEKYK